MADLRASLVLLLAAALCACARPAPPPSAPPMTIALGQPTTAGTDRVYPIFVTNDGARPSARLRLGCRFSDAEGDLVFTGGFDMDRLAPGETRSAPILVPRDVAVAHLSCSVDPD